MESRITKVNFSTAGGTASNGALTSKITLPTAWLAELGIMPDSRNIELHFDGTQIQIIPKIDYESFAFQKLKQGHDVRVLRFYDNKILCSTILADFTDKTISIKNENVDLILTAFGRNGHPSWKDFEKFLEERCIPRSRSGLREYLETIGVDEYDPLKIIEKTQGRMAEDYQWLEVEKLK